MIIARYFVVGGVAAVVDIGLFTLFTQVLGFSWFPVATGSFVLATVVNYVLSIRHVFESGIRFGRHAEIALTFLVSLIGLAINQLVLWILIERGGADLVLAKVTATGVVFFWNYGSRKYFVFRESGRMPDPGSS